MSMVRRGLVDRAMRPDGVVVHAPRLDRRLRIMKLTGRVSVMAQRQCW
jgi:hypothetical protein